MLPDGILFLELDVLRTVDFEVRPINRALVKVLNAQTADGNLLVGAGIFGMFAPFVRCGNNQAAREGGFARCGKKRINVFFGQVMSRIEKLALNGCEIPRRPLLGNQVNAGVRLIAASRPFHPKPDITVKIRKIRVFSKISSDETFKFVAKIAAVGGLFAENFEYVVNCLFHSSVGIADNYRICESTESANQFRGDLHNG